MDGSTRENMLLDDWEECSGCSVWYKLHVPKRRSGRSIYHSKDPFLSCCCSASVVLEIMKMCVVNVM